MEFARSYGESVFHFIQKSPCFPACLLYFAFPEQSLRVTVSLYPCLAQVGQVMQKTERSRTGLRKEPKNKNCGISCYVAILLGSPASLT